MNNLLAIFILFLLVLLLIVAFAVLLIASPFLLVAWVCGGCPTGDNGPYYTLSWGTR